MKGNTFMPKIGLSCRSELLLESLKLLLKHRNVPLKDADLIISDRRFNAKKALLVVGEDIRLPFTREMLMEKIDQILKERSQREPENERRDEKPETIPEQRQLTKEELEEIIARLNKKHQQMISRLIRAYHES